MSKAEKDNERWKKQTLWHYEVAEDRGGLGFWVTRNPIQSWRFWALAPSAAYWLAAQLNIQMVGAAVTDGRGDRKSTRLNSSHSSISYAVFCLKKKITQLSV